MERALLVAILVGLVQGVFEWLPISSEGNVALALTLVGRSPERAVAFALFLHLATALSATVYYRDRLAAVVRLVPEWHPNDARAGEMATITFLAVGTVVSGVVGIAAYATLNAVVSALTGGLFVVLVGVLLIGTGLFQRLSGSPGLGAREVPTLGDAVLVGVAQGIAILPGISRSGMTAGALLVRGYDGPTAFRLSFLLSIPAALGAGAVAYADVGLGGVAPSSAVVALVVAAVVGYATIDALMRVVERVSFWGVCVGLGTLAAVGGLLVL